MRDMHDGIGGQLISATAAARGGAKEELVDSLEVALTDLRLMIDSFEPVYGDLTTVLGIIRMRLEKRLNNHGLHFDWQVDDIAEVPDLAPHKVLQVMRIIEEAVTNIVRHANAKKITVMARDGINKGDAGVFVEIKDDGKGIDDNIRKGRGLDNMNRRAEAIGGKLLITAANPGTLVSLWLPTESSNDEMG